MTFPRRAMHPLGALLGQVQARFHEDCEARMAAAGFGDLSLAHGVNVMRHLQPGVPRRISEVVRLSTVTKQAISQQVAYLVERGYVAVTPDERDRRAKCVWLTVRGEAAQATTRRIFGEVESDWRDRYGADRMRELFATLEAIVTHPE